MNISKSLLARIDDLKKELEEKVIDLIAEEAEPSIKYKAGDVIESAIAVGRVESAKIDIYPESRRYEVYYVCEQMTRKGKPFKRKKKVIISAKNIIDDHVK